MKRGGVEVFSPLSPLYEPLSVLTATTSVNDLLNPLDILAL